MSQRGAGDDSSVFLSKNISKIFVGAAGPHVGKLGVTWYARFNKQEGRMLINHVPCFHHFFVRWSLKGDWCRSNQMTRLEQSEYSLTDGKKYLQYFIFSPKLRKLFFKLNPVTSPEHHSQGGSYRVAFQFDFWKRNENISFDILDNEGTYRHIKRRRAEKG